MRSHYTLFTVCTSILLVSCISSARRTIEETALARNLNEIRVLGTQSAESTATVQAITTLTPDSPGQISLPTEYYDADHDQLSYVNEAIAGTDPDKADTDGDTLSDYDETTKYFTDPLKADSDGDGIPDSDPGERREYTRTLVAVMSIRPPFDINMMTDHYQDVEVIEEAYTLTFQVTFYKDAYHIIEEARLGNRTDWYGGLDAYLAPDPLMNFDEQMSSDAWDLLSPGAHTDLDLVENLYAWERENVEVCPGSEDASCSYYTEPFLDYYVSSDGEIKSVLGTGEDFTPPGFPYDEAWKMEHIILGKEMFYNQTRGNSGSTANFYSTILRSIGIPTRITQSIPAFNADHPNEMLMLESLSSQTQIELLNRAGYNQFICEAFIGNRWVRLDSSGYEIGPELGGAFIKIHTFPTWQGVDFAHSWGMGGRPYELISIEEHEPIRDPLRLDFE